MGWLLDQFVRTKKPRQSVFSNWLLQFGFMCRICWAVKIVVAVGAHRLKECVGWILSFRVMALLPISR